MSNVSELIAMLRSPNANKRYEACEELRVRPKIPEAAKAALRAVINDPDPLVSSAAIRALDVHPPRFSLPSPLSDLALAIFGFLVAVLAASSLFAIVNCGDYDCAEQLAYFLTAPIGHGCEPLQLMRLLLLVAPICALGFRRIKPPILRIGFVTVVACVSGIFFDFAMGMAIAYACT